MTQAEFLKLYDNLQEWESENLKKPLSCLDEIVKTVNLTIFEITPTEMLELFPNRLEAMEYYKNIHCLSVLETVKLFPATLVKISFISFEYGYTPSSDGYCEIWVWKGGSGSNEKYISTTPIYEVLNSKQIYDLYCGETIQITQETLDKNFKLLC